jgi:hypothetical protein
MCIYMAYQRRFCDSPAPDYRPKSKRGLNTLNFHVLVEKSLSTIEQLLLVLSTESSSSTPLPRRRSDELHPISDAKRYRDTHGK